MILGNKKYEHLSNCKAFLLTGLLLLGTFSNQLSANSLHPKYCSKKDTIPQTEVYNLKRADIYVVIMEADSVHIRLKNRDSIMMSRASFDTLPVEVRKEMSARNDGLFSSVQVESAYPGGPSGWLSFLNRTFSYPQEAIRNGIEGVVVIQFIVDDQGKVSDIEAVSDPISGGLCEEAIRVIKRSGKWEPAIWNGYKVTSYKKQPLIFGLTR